MKFPVQATPAEASASLEFSQGGARMFGAPRSGGARLHAGIDLYAPDGSNAWANRKVLAATDGQVVGIYSAGPTYGHMVVVKSSGKLPWEPGREVRYVHLNSGDIAVKLWQTVTTGQLIGTLYAANGFGVHLHFQLGPAVPKGASLDSCIDPYPVLKANAFEQPKPKRRKRVFTTHYSGQDRTKHRTTGVFAGKGHPGFEDVDIQAWLDLDLPRGIQDPVRINYFIFPNDGRPKIGKFVVLTPEQRHFSCNLGALCHGGFTVGARSTNQKVVAFDLAVKMSGREE